MTEVCLSLIPCVGAVITLVIMLRVIEVIGNITCIRSLSLFTKLVGRLRLLNV